MLVRKIDHINIRTARFADTVKFYVDVLGMKNARMPGSPEDRPASFIEDGSGAFAIHLIPVDPADPAADYDRMMRSRRGLEGMPPPSFHGSGAVDHIAFECDDYAQMIERLKATNTPHAEGYVEQINLRQIFVVDPNGITLELNFK
jgi:catechol 2,3-dioxygenase-like lactoylglutathione lyase family enzyme